MVSFDIAHAESAELGISIEFKRPSPALLALLTSPLGPPQPNDVFHGLGKSRNNAVPMRVLMYVGINPVINKLAVAQRSLAGLAQTDVRIATEPQIAAPGIARDTLFPAF